MQSPKSHSPSPSPSPVQFVESGIPENRSPIIVDESDSVPTPAPVIEFRQAIADGDSLAKSSLSVQLVGVKRGSDAERVDQNGGVKRLKLGERKEEVSAVVVDDDDDEEEEEGEGAGAEEVDVQDVELVREDEGEEKGVGEIREEIQFVEMREEERRVEVGAGAEDVDRKGEGADEMSHEMGIEEKGKDGEEKIIEEKKEETAEQEEVRKGAEVKGEEGRRSEDKQGEGGGKVDMDNVDDEGPKVGDPKNDDKDIKAPSMENAQREDSKKQDTEKAKEKDGGEAHLLGSDDEEEAPLDLAAMSAFEYEQVAKLTPIQLRRYEQYRRSDLKNGKVKKVLVHLNPILTKASEQYVIAVKGLAKLFVGDVVESALGVKKQLGDKGALQPKHLREAYRRLRGNGAIPTVNDKSNLFS